MRAAVYVSCAGSGEVHVLALDEASGTLDPLQVVAPGGTLMPMALSPDRHRLYVARRSDPLAVLTFAIEATTGRLEPLGEAPLPASMAYVSTDGTGRWLLAASYGEHVVSVSPIDAQGIAQAAVQVLPAGTHAHAIQPAPGNRFVFSTALGSDRVQQFRFDAPAGRLEPNDPRDVTLTPGTGPRHLAFHPHLPSAYVIGELDASVTVLALDAVRGTLRPIQTADAMPPGVSIRPWAAEIRIAPDGLGLVASERNTSMLALFAIDPADGRLALRGHAATQAEPRGMALSPTGRWVIAAGQRSNRIGVHRLDFAGGTAVPGDERAVGLDPNWVETLPLP